ncbi:hypothetical protein TIFTF001_042910, partial [Ficus carica]
DEERYLQSRSSHATTKHAKKYNEQRKASPTTTTTTTVATATPTSDLWIRFTERPHYRTAFDARPTSNNRTSRSTGDNERRRHDEEFCVRGNEDT